MAHPAAAVAQASSADSGATSRIAATVPVAPMHAVLVDPEVLRQIARCFESLECPCRDARD
jgi:hypothetical protein